MFIQDSLRRPASGRAMLAIGVLVSSLAIGAGPIITVDTVEDTVDFAGTISDLPGPDGHVSFREALQVANQTPGPQTIEFAIPASEWWTPASPADAGLLAWLKLTVGSFVLIDDETTVDFASQAVVTGGLRSGNQVGIYASAYALNTPGLRIDGDGCIIRGLDRVANRPTGISVRGNSNHVVGCTIQYPSSAVALESGSNGQAPRFNVIGGAGPGEGNALHGYIYGIRMLGGAASNIIVGNTLSAEFPPLDSYGIALLGTAAAPVRFNRIGGPTAAERNVIHSAGGECGEGWPCGAQVTIRHGIGNTIEGNFIGTNASGTQPMGGHAPYGILVSDSEATVIRGNVIADIRQPYFVYSCWCSGVHGFGIFLEGATANTLITNNVIGADVTGTAPMPNQRGIGMSNQSPSPRGTRIGGLEPGEGNLIVHNVVYGISVPGNVSGCEIAGNSIALNGGLGVDLSTGESSGGVTPNDRLDLDVGGNGLQNFPEISSAVTDGEVIDISASLHSSPDDVFRVEFFGIAACDRAGHGEGAELLGWIIVSTDAFGDAPFETTLKQPMSSANYLTATATLLATHDTSEFAACTTITWTGSHADLNHDGTISGFDLALLLSVWTGSSMYTPCPPQHPADLNRDCGVNGLDLALLLAAWS